MKLGLAFIGLVVCSVAHADLNSSSQNLSNCVISFAESQIKTPMQANDIAEDAFEKCRAELKEVHDSIGPNKAQWDSLSDQQKHAISTIRDQTTSKIREKLSSQVVTFVNESRKSA
ncbi:hypothetical protein [Erwinia phyllosphaerae]|uniref:hypothetical protein n=1 Tax=Erwinia phyllosphaerae TaxID=2853256 RepID=UPI001FEF48B8|nr:hypothetical protein [Erwinia phyllosphaerae]MBV4366502.1 hypothetical protein [Erwinia phyllosphaerae]